MISDSQIIIDHSSYSLKKRVNNFINFGKGYLDLVILGVKHILVYFLNYSIYTDKENNTKHVINKTLQFRQLINVLYK